MEARAGCAWERAPNRHPARREGERAHAETPWRTSPVRCRQTGRSTTNHTGWVRCPVPRTRRSPCRVCCPSWARDGTRPRRRAPTAQHRGRAHLAAGARGDLPGHRARARRGRRRRPARCARTDAHHSEGARHLEHRLPPAHPRPRRGDGLPVLPGRRPRRRPPPNWPPTTSRPPAASSRRASYGRFTLRPHPLRAAGSGCRTRPPRTPYSATGAPRGRAAYLRDALAAADPHVDFSRYDIVYFVADPDAPGVDSDATKVVNLDTPAARRRHGHPPGRHRLRAAPAGPAASSPTRPATSSTCPTSTTGPADGKGDWDTYVGDWDLMGSQFGLAPDLFAWHKWKLGWLDPRQVVCVRGAGPDRLTLEPRRRRPGGAGRRRGPRPRRPSGSAAASSSRWCRTGRRQRARHRGRARAGRQRPARPAATGILVYRVRSGARVRRRPGRGRRRPPAHRGLLGRVGLPAARRRPDRPRRELHRAGGAACGSTVEGRTASGEWTVTITPGVEPERRAGEVCGHTKRPLAARGASCRLCAARDSNPGPAD